MDTEIVRVLRVVEYEGPRGWVEETVLRSIHGEKNVASGKDAVRKVIRAATVTPFPVALPAPPPVPPDPLAAAASDVCLAFALSGPLDGPVAALLAALNGREGKS